MINIEEINIYIEITEALIHDLQIAITSPTEYGRWPTDADFKLIASKSRELEKANEKQDTLTDLREAIENNDKAEK